MPQETSDRPVFWRALYALVVGELAVTVAVLYALTRWAT